MVETNSQNTGQISATSDSEISSRITSLRFILMVLVIFIHNNFSVASCMAGGITFNQGFVSYWIQNILSNNIANCAVPLFFMFSSYFFYRKERVYADSLKNKVFTLLVPMVLWTVVNMLMSFAPKFLAEKLIPEIINKPGEYFFTGWSIAKWFQAFIGYGFDSVNHPYAGQFWFVRDLFVLFVISPILKKVFLKNSVLVMAVSGVLLISGAKLYILETQSLFFFIIGLWWAVRKIDLFKCADEINWIVTILTLAFSIFLNIKSNHTPGAYWFMVVSSCFLLLKVSKKIISSEKLFEVLKYLSGYSFFLFAIHMPVLLNTVRTKWIHVFPMENDFLCLFEYFGVTLVIIVAGTAAGMLLKKILPPVFAVLNGGR